VCNIAELAEIYLQTQSRENKVNSRHTVNPRKMATMVPKKAKEGRKERRGRATEKLSSNLGCISNCPLPCGGG
jgi:hypothetical protein